MIRMIYCWDNYATHYIGRGWNKGDVVSIIFDVSNKSLSIKLNEDEEVEFAQDVVLEDGTKYNIAISMAYLKKDIEKIVKLIDF